MVDIVNNHHPEYYRGVDAPGDWDSPNPVYFLAIKPRTPFQFVLTLRRRDADLQLLHDAATCLQMALTQYGAGAKTAAGYGCFALPNTTNSSHQSNLVFQAQSRSSHWKLQLESPAFLAGANPDKQGECELRSATLRGQLRAWWRTLQPNGHPKDAVAKSISQAVIEQQFQGALWLLGRFGSVGSNCRKGFGSLRIDGDWKLSSLEQIRMAADSQRRELGLGTSLQEDLVESQAIFHSGTITGEAIKSVRTGREAIELAGQAYASVAAEYKHQEIKAGLGLPRKIHGPKDDPMDRQSAASHKRPVFLDTRRRTQRKVEDARYSSPIHLHIAEVANGQWCIRWLGMPAVDLPTLAENAAFLKEFLARFEKQLSQSSLAASNQGNPRSAASINPVIRQGFEQVRVTVLQVIQAGIRKQFKVQEVGKPKAGMLVDGTPPDTLPSVGDEVTAYRSTTSDPNSPRYRWNPPTQTTNKPNSKSKQR